jgi:hypothetical protein
MLNVLSRFSQTNSQKARRLETVLLFCEDQVSVSYLTDSIVALTNAI